jgi:DNA-binding response OmpR family regulator
MTSRENIRSGFAGCRVLVAEDDPLIAAELNDTLCDLGVEVVGPVPTVGAAMAAIESGTPDVAVLDVNLRNSSSAPLVDVLRAAAVPHVLVTGYSRNLLDEPCMRGVPILSKPVRRRELIAFLERAISRTPPSMPG